MTLPFRINNNVGIDRMLNLADSDGASSELSLSSRVCRHA